MIPVPFRFKTLFKSKFLGFVEAPVGVFLYHYKKIVSAFSNWQSSKPEFSESLEKVSVSKNPKLQSRESHGLVTFENLQSRKVSV